MAFKARDGLPKVQLDRMSKAQLVTTVKKLQKRETALLNQIAKLQAAAVVVEVADALQGVNAFNSNDLKPGHIVQTLTPNELALLRVPALMPNELALLRRVEPWGTRVAVTPQEPPDWRLANADATAAEIDGALQKGAEPIDQSSLPDAAQEHSQGSLGDQSNPPTPFPWEKT